MKGRIIIVADLETLLRQAYEHGLKDMCKVHFDKWLKEMLE